MLAQKELAHAPVALLRGEDEKVVALEVVGVLPVHLHSRHRRSRGRGAGQGEHEKPPDQGALGWLRGVALGFWDLHEGTGQGYRGLRGARVKERVREVHDWGEFGARVLGGLIKARDRGRGCTWGWASMRASRAARLLLRTMVQAWSTNTASGMAACSATVLRVCARGWGGGTPHRKPCQRRFLFRGEKEGGGRKSVAACYCRMLWLHALVSFFCMSRGLVKAGCSRPEVGGGAWALDPLGLRPRRASCTR